MYKTCDRIKNISRDFVLSGDNIHIHPNFFRKIRTKRYKKDSVKWRDGENRMNLIAEGILLPAEINT